MTGGYDQRLTKLDHRTCQRRKKQGLDEALTMRTRGARCTVQQIIAFIEWFVSYTRLAKKISNSQPGDVDALTTIIWLSTLRYADAMSK